MLSALLDRDRWLDEPWSSFVATAANEPAELLARVAARHGSFVVAELTKAASGPLGLMLAVQAARTSWRYALAAVAIDDRAFERDAILARERERAGRPTFDALRDGVSSRLIPSHPV